MMALPVLYGTLLALLLGRYRRLRARRSSDKSGLGRRIPIWRHPAVIAALPLTWLPLSALNDLRNAEDVLDRVCKRSGLCHVAPLWHQHPMDAAAWSTAMRTGRHFDLTATSDADCRASEGCVLAGECTVVDGACTVATDKDCRKSWPCVDRGMCSAVGGKCVL